MPQSLRISAIAVLFASLLCAIPAPAQVATGTPALASFGGGPDVINLGNLNAHLDVPIRSRNGRGTSFTYDLVYDSSVWYPIPSGSSNTWQPVANWGWSAQTQVVTGYVTYGLSHAWCGTGSNQVLYYIYTFGDYLDKFGTLHYIGLTVDTSSQQCTFQVNPFSASATLTDGSGYKITVTANPSATVNSPSGTVIHPPLTTGTGVGSFTDRNGNQFNVDGSGHFYDTLSSSAAVLTVSGSGTASNPMVFSYSPPSSSANCPAISQAVACYTVNYTNYTVATGFGVSGISEYKSSAAVPLVSSIVLPDGSRYSFSYETTPGSCTPYAGTTCVTARPASITLPTGAEITYLYSFSGCTAGNGGIFSDGSASCLKRSTPDGTWTYTRSLISGNHWQTLVSDATTPTANQTLIDFQKDGGTTSNFYEVQRNVYHGAQGGTLVETVNTCYNGATFPCTTTGLATPFSAVAVNPILPGATNLQSEHITKFDSFGNVTETDDYDWGASIGPLLRKRTISYASLTGIVSFPQQVTTYNSGNAVVSQTNYNYGDTVTTTSGTPQHTTPPGSRGNVLSVNYYTSASAYLTKSMTYFDTGNVQTVTDANGAQTTYAYGACGNAFPTTINEPLSLVRYMTWNCTGGVQLTSEDENQQTTTTAYSDAYYWRPASVTDPLQNAVGYYYQPNPTCSTPWEVEQYVEFNGNSSIVSNIQYLDGLGRTYVTQQRQNPSASTLDSVSYTFDANGRPNTVSMPCSIGWAATCSTPKTTTTYDALNRPLVVTDGGNGTVTYTYTQNDVLVTVGPAPTGENAKQHQLEYDALGRLTSVCEITSGTTLAPAGTCGQTNSKTGYWTKYSYDANGNLTQVTQNAQGTPQPPRSYSYDFLSRLTSESNPESASTTYTYDTDSTCGNSSGDLVKKVDYVGNVTCTAYDALHRPTSITYPSGAYASVTQIKTFVYDAATVNGVAMSNAKGRLAEAYTTGAISIQNPGFESSSTLPPPGWMGSGATLSYDTSTPYAGARSLKVAATQQYGGAEAALMPGVAGKQYTIAGYMKSDGACSANTQLGFYSSSHSYLGSAQAAAGTATSWTYVLTTATAPAGTAYTLITLQNNSAGGAGVCEFDNISGSSNALGADEGFSYTARGETSDIYEWTPNSGGYYHVNQTYWAHGVTNQLSSSISGLPTFTYGVDGEGRPSTVSASSGQNPVTAMSYNLYPTSGPPQITATYGSADSDVFSLDANTWRTTKYQFNVGSQSDTGSLLWNANGSLNQLAITDGLNSADNQTCTYSHDDLSRIATANCGTAANQTFSYDAFGNINKSGSPYTFQPNYNSSTNRISSVGGFTPTYDANGNTLTDPSHTYSWNTDSHALTIDSVGLTYDAFGRMVEQNRSGSYTQIVYAPTGGKLALMNGQTLQKAIIPLPGGGEAVYNSSGLLYYGHSDHLGNIRLGSTPSRTMYFDMAYAPFGETYATSGTLDPAFTGQRSDTVSGLFDFPAREYSNEGRWHSPDPAGLAAVDPSNPQSWNRYAYVRNSPMNSIDPTGMADCLGGEPCFKDPGEDWGDVFGSNNFWNGSPTIGLGGTTHEFDLLNIPLVDARTRLPWYSVAGGDLLLAQPGTLTFVPNPDWDPNDFNSIPGTFLLTTNWLDLGPIALSTVSVLGPAAVTRASGNAGNSRETLFIHATTGPPRVPPSWLNCSFYRDGTGAGEILYQICSNTPDNNWSNCVRGKLLNQWTPNPNPFQLVWYLGPDHAYDFATCAAGR